MNVPSFIIVGAAKTGTSWLYRCLDEHPEVYVSPQVEVNFFSYHYEKGQEWYQRLFEDGNQAKAIGEKSPSYMVDPKVPERIYDINPHVKLIFVFRNPVARAYSYYCMLLRANKVSENVDEALMPGTRLVRGGRYYEHLRHFRRVFEDEQIKCLVYDDLQEDPKGFIREVYTYIGVDPLFEAELINRKYHARKPRPRFQNIYNRLVDLSKWIARQSSSAAKALQLIRSSRWPDVFHRLNQGPDFPEMTGETKNRLAKHYLKDTERLSNWMGRDLTEEWLSPYLNRDVQ